MTVYATYHHGPTMDQRWTNNGLPWINNAHGKHSIRDDPYFYRGVGWRDGGEGSGPWDADFGEDHFGVVRGMLTLE